MLRVKDDQGNATYIKDEDGNVVKSRLNQTLLQQIATDANGFYLPLQGANPMETLYARGLAPLPKTEESTRLTRVYQERYHWPLGFAIVCLVIELLLPESPRVRRTVAPSPAPAARQAAAVIASLLIALTAHGSPSSAYRDYQSGDFKSALDEYNRLAEQKTNDYRLHYDAGAAAYRAKELERAQKQFNDALNSQGIVADPKAQENAYYDLGNTLYHMGEPLPDPDKKKELWQQAIENLGRAYRLDTNDIDARNNLAYVKKKLEELKQQQQQQQNQKQDQKTTRIRKTRRTSRTNRIRKTRKTKKTTSSSRNRPTRKRRTKKKQSSNKPRKKATRKSNNSKPRPILLINATRTPRKANKRGWPRLTCLLKKPASYLNPSKTTRKS